LPSPHANAARVHSLWNLSKGANRMSGHTCIYCKSQENAFDREHVMPEAFGTFEPESLILYDTVCKPCNGHFGRGLELALSRDSMEAVLRLRYGIKPASEAKKLPYRRLELKVGQPGPWLGATVVLEPDRTGEGIEPVPVPQVAFRWKTESEWTWFLERELGDTWRLAPYRGAPLGTLEIRILGPSSSDHARLVEKLKEAGIKFTQQRLLEQPMTEDGTIQLQIAAQVDDTIFRAIAKIAFNYAAYVHGPGFVLRSDFDDARNYIRYGTHPRWTPVVRPFKAPILTDDLPHFRQTNGHLITFDWNYKQTGLVAQISLFNAITYRVLLCPRYSGLWRGNVRRGHHFDIESRVISPLTCISFGPILIQPMGAKRSL
jgi:HNH endonuclease